LASAAELGFWPLALIVAVAPWVPIDGAPAFAPAMRMMSALLGTTALTHAVFFGEDRYHIVVVPVLCIFAAAALRSREQNTNGARPVEGKRRTAS